MSNNENLFEGKSWNPSGNGGEFHDLIVKEARGVFSRYNLALFLYTAVAYAVVFALELILSIALGIEEYTKLLDNVYIQWLFGVGLMYLIGFPVFFLIIRKMPVNKGVKKKMGAKEFFAFLLVAQAFILAGNLIGQSLNGVIGALFDRNITDATSELIEKSPVWLIFIVVVIIGPIIEELLFRKLMIDRISKYGDTLAIIVSAVAFGLFHGNFYQFFYACFLGLLLGYMYTKTRDVKYTVIMHMIINFLGSVAVLPLMDMQEALLSGTVPETGSELQAYLYSLMCVGSYSVIQYAMAISGFVIFINAIKNRQININKYCQVYIPKERVAGAVLGNVGTILFLIMSLSVFLLSIFLV